MGSLKPFKSHALSGLAPEAGDVLISVLMNSVYYFLDHAFIIAEKNKNRYRLLVFHNNEVLTDQTYKNLRGARVAFFRLFRYKAYDNKYSKPEWTPLYHPEQEWLDAQYKICDTSFAGKDILKPAQMTLNAS
jgi:hypothetical protein